MRFLLKRLWLFVRYDAMKLDWQAIFTSRIFWVIVAAIAGLLLLAYLFASVDSCRFQSRQDKLKADVNSAVKEIGNINSQIANLNERKAEVKEGIKRDTEELVQSIEGHEEAKKATNAALANYNAAVNANSNVDRSAQDILDALEKLK